MLSRRSRNKVISTLSNQINKNNLIGITMIGQSKRDNSIYDNHSLGGYAIFNVNYITNIEDYELSIKMNNIFDRKYRLAHDYNTEGRSIYLTLTTTFM